MNCILQPNMALFLRNKIHDDAQTKYVIHLRVMLQASHPWTRPNVNFFLPDPLLQSPLESKVRLAILLASILFAST